MYFCDCLISGLVSTIVRLFLEWNFRLSVTRLDFGRFSTGKTNDSSDDLFVESKIIIIPICLNVGHTFTIFHGIMLICNFSRRSSAIVAASRFIGYSAIGAITTSCIQQRTTTLCESSGERNNFFDSLLPKDADGKICWDKAPQQLTDSIFWDKVGKAAGQKVW
jgi:hypothetical protein